MSARGAVVAVGGGLLAAAATVLILRLAGVTVPWQVALPAGVALGVLLLVGACLPHADPGQLEPPEQPQTPPTAALGDFGALQFAMQGAAIDADRFEQRIRPRLCALAVDRLWQHHGLDWRRDAHQLPARDVVGPHTWALLTAPPDSLRLTPAALDAWLDELEAL